MSEDETCPKKMAGFRVYVEDRVPAVLEKYWIATEYQIPKLKRDLACKSPPSNPSCNQSCNQPTFLGSKS
jgi:hypothetical protein